MADSWRVWCPQTLQEDQQQVVRGLHLPQHLVTVVIGGYRSVWPLELLGLLVAVPWVVAVVMKRVALAAWLTSPSCIGLRICKMLDKGG